jgi:hypothetical protein
MDLAVVLQYYPHLIFKSLRSTELFRNEFISSDLYIANRILLFLCYDDLGINDFWIFRLCLFLFLFSLAKYWCTFIISSDES